MIVNVADTNNSEIAIITILLLVWLFVIFLIRLQYIALFLQCTNVLAQHILVFEVLFLNVNCDRVLSPVKHFMVALKNYWHCILIICPIFSVVSFIFLIFWQLWNVKLGVSNILYSMSSGLCAVCLVHHVVWVYIRLQNNCPYWDKALTPYLASSVYFNVYSVSVYV